MEADNNKLFNAIVGVTENRIVIFLTSTSNILQWFFYFMDKINRLKDKTAIQLKIVRQIKEALDNPFFSKNTMYTSIWLQPTTGKFLFQDLYVDSEIIIELIKIEVIKYKKIGFHQGERMLQYTLKLKRK